MLNTVAIDDDGLNGPDATNTDNLDSDETPINAAPNYTVVIDDSQSSVLPGETVSYTIVVTNVGDQVGTGVIVNDNFPIDILTNVTAGNRGIVDGGAGTVTWNVGDLAPGESVVLTMSGQNPSDFGEWR